MTQFDGSLTADVILYREAKGFTPTTWETLPTRLCCLFAEIEELAEAMDSEAQVDIRYETADIAMYTLTILHDLYSDKPLTLRERYHSGAPLFSSSHEITAPLRREVRKAFECWRRGDRKEVMICMEILLCALIDVRLRVLGLPTNIGHDVRCKIASSLNRPKLHGGKNPAS